MLKIVKSFVKKPIFLSSEFFNTLVVSFYSVINLIFKLEPIVISENVLTAFQIAAGDCVLVLAPHPDDETAGMGGTISQLQDFGVEIIYALLTDGADSKAGELANVSAGERAVVREKEFSSAVNILGNNFELLGPIANETREWPTDKQCEEHIKNLVEHLNDKNIKIIFSPPPFDFHPHHRAGAFIGQKVSAELKSKPRVLCYEVQAPFRAYQPDIWLRLRKIDQRRKNDAFEVYHSQRQTLKTVRRLNGLRRRLSFSSYPVEVFSTAENLDNETPLTHGMMPAPFKDLKLLFRPKTL